MAASERTDDAELRRLRARAYGRDADIGDDHVAVARLRALEAAERTRTQPARKAQRPVADDAGRPTGTMPVDAGVQLTAPVDIAPMVPMATLVDPPQGRPPAPRPRWRSWIVRALAALLIATVAGLAGAFLARGGSISAPWPAAPAAVLGGVAEVEEGIPPWLDTVDAREYFAAGEDVPFRPFDAFSGVRPWAITTAQGGQCLILVMSGAGGYDVGCGVGQLDAVADIRVSEALLEGGDLTDYPRGSMLRFVLRGERVEVWVAVPENS